MVEENRITTERHGDLDDWLFADSESSVSER